MRELMEKHGTDKFYLHGYDGEYERHFAPLSGRPVNLLEIGIGGYQVENTGGESLRLWAEYFPNGQITGIDAFDKSHCNTDRIRTFKGNQNDEAFLRRVNDKAGPFDIVIDDGSHIQSGILTSFNTLFPLLNLGGYYVIEDLQTAYHPDFGGEVMPLRGLGQGMTSIRLLANLIDGLHAAYWKARSPSNIQNMVQSVHVAKDIAFIKKKG